MGALDGLRVVDVTTHLSGPYCSMLLADMGADVVKVERPDGGDEARRMPQVVNGESAPFMLFNRNKRGVVLDLKTPPGQDACRRLGADGDVFLENMKPGTAARLGLGYEELSRVSPRLIYCSISGFGQTGPYRERGGFDLVAQGMSGLMSITGEEDGPPLRVPIPISDRGDVRGAGHPVRAGGARAHRPWPVGGHLAARDPIALSVYEAASYFATGEVPERLGPGHRASAPYQAFRTKDGWITIGGIATVLAPALQDPRSRIASPGPPVHHGCRTSAAPPRAGGIAPGAL